MSDPTCPGGKERDERIGELEADLATVAPVVRAAMWYANAEAQRNDAEAVMAMGQIYDCVRDIPADVLERLMRLEQMGVSNECL